MNAIAARAIEAMDFLVDAVQQIPSESWDQPSNLDGWSIRGSRGAHHGQRRQARGTSRGAETSEATDDLQQLAARLKDALARKDPDTALSFPIVGLTIHGWDVYQSHISRSRFPTTCWRSAVRWWRPYPKTSCVGQGCSGRPSPHPRMPRRPPDSWPTSDARPKTQMRAAVV